MQDYFAGSDIAKNYEKIFFLPRVLQSQELNGLQAISETRFQRLTRAFFHDGEIIDGSWSADGNTLKTKGIVVIANGLPRCVVDSDLELPAGTQAIYAILKETFITATEDPGLLDPFDGENFGKEGALRQKSWLELAVSTNQPLPPEAILIWHVKGTYLIRAKSACASFAAGCFDHVIDLDHDPVDLSDMQPWSKVIITGKERLITSPIAVGGTHITIEFAPNAFLFTDRPLPYFFEVLSGSVKISGIRLGFKDNSLPQDVRSKTKIARVVKGSSLHLHDYTVVGGLQARTFEGEGVFQHNVVWEESL